MEHADCNQQPIEGAASKVSSTADIGSEELHVTTATSKKFKGDGAPSHNTKADAGTLTKQNSKLYDDTTSYAFTPGGSLPDTIDFKNDNATILGTWKGTFKPKVTDSFSGMGSWK